MFKQVVQVESPGGEDATEASKKILFADEESAKEYLSICNKFVECGDIWFTHVDFSQDGTKIVITRIFDSEEALDAFNEAVLPWKSKWNAIVLIKEEITFEEFAEFASQNEEVAIIEIPE